MIYIFNHCWVNELERSQAKLRLEHLHVKTARDVEEAHQAMYAKHSAKSALASGATVKVSIKLIEEHANRYLDQAINLVGQVSKDEEAFDLIVANLTATFRTFESHKRIAARHACGGPSRDPAADIINAADTKFAEVRDLVMRRLKIERYAFASAAVSSERGNTVQREKVAISKNPGGKPLAAHWDAMWATIAVKLWTGSLCPKSQADVKRAMFDWFNQAEVEVGDTAITQRARQLWQAMQDADS